MNREQLIKDRYIEIQLESGHFDLYVVRRAILNAVKQNIENFKGDLLDVGCGIMPYKELILGSNKKVISYKGVDFQSAIHGEYELVKPDFFWDGKTLPLSDASIDTVLATELFEHCAYPEDVMKEMLRVLKPGGMLFLTVPFIWHLHLVPHDEYRYTPFSLKRHLQNAGFKSINMHSLGGWDASLAQMIAMWFTHRPLSDRKRKLLHKICKPVIQKLIKTDKYFPDLDDFKDCKMITGIWAIAYKPSVC